MVVSDSSPRPHFVQKATGGKFLCGDNCPMWRGRKVCAHTIAVAESLSCLQQFIETLQRSKLECSVTKLVTTSSDRRKAGTKSGAPRKRGSELRKAPITTYRSRLDDVCSPDLENSSSMKTTPSTSSIGYGQHSSIAAKDSSISGDISVGCTSQASPHNTEVTIQIISLHPHGMDQIFVIPLIRTVNHKECMAMTIAHMDHTFIHLHKYFHLHTVRLVLLLLQIPLL